MPLRGSFGKPVNFYRAVAHRVSIAHLCSMATAKRPEGQGRSPDIPRLKYLGSTGWRVSI
jgi:hypothetical protein